MMINFIAKDKEIFVGLEVTPPHTVTQEKASCVPDKELREDRQISRMLIQVQKDITKRKNRIRKFLDFHGYEEEFPAGTWYDRDYKALEEFKFPEPLQVYIWASIFPH